jgi:ThiF family
VSRKLIDHSPDLLRLRSEGYEIQYKEGFLIASSIPYLNSDGKLGFGALACELSFQNNVANPPAAHPVWWQGEYPYQVDRTPIEAIRNSTPGKILFSEFEVNFLFSAYPSGPGTIPTGYVNFYDKITTYIGIISGPALHSFPDAPLKTKRIFPDDDDDSPFLYPDTNSSRAEINVISDKLKNQKIAIIGAGGTGSYILDLVAKTSVSEIHLFDNDYFGQHNAFRYPGAASPQDVDAKSKKVNYLKNIYSRFRKGIFEHDFKMTEEYFHLLDPMTFIFVSIDKTEIKQTLFEYLINRNIPFINVGIGVTRHQDSLTATAIVTAVNSKMNQHIGSRVSLGPDDDEKDEYNTNIQLAEINSLNAAIAVIHWKRQYGFYNNFDNAMHLQISIDGLRIFPDDYPA